MVEEEEEKKKRKENLYRKRKVMMKGLTMKLGAKKPRLKAADPESKPEESSPSPSETKPSPSKSTKPSPSNSTKPSPSKPKSKEDTPRPKKKEKFDEDEVPASQAVVVDSKEDDLDEQLVKAKKSKRTKQLDKTIEEKDEEDEEEDADSGNDQEDDDTNGEDDDDANDQEDDDANGQEDDDSGNDQEDDDSGNDQEEDDEEDDELVIPKAPNSKDYKKIISQLQKVKKELKEKDNMVKDLQEKVKKSNSRRKKAAAKPKVPKISAEELEIIKAEEKFRHDEDLAMTQAINRTCRVVEFDGKYRRVQVVVSKKSNKDAKKDSLSSSESPSENGKGDSKYVWKANGGTYYMFYGDLVEVDENESAGSVELYNVYRKNPGGQCDTIDEEHQVEMPMIVPECEEIVKTTFSENMERLWEAKCAALKNHQSMKRKLNDVVNEMNKKLKTEIAQRELDQKNASSSDEEEEELSN